MKIVAGLGSVKDYAALCEAGADEVFCGFVPYEWNEQFGNIQPLNRREVFYYNVQISSVTDMLILKKMENKYGVGVTITFNSLYYNAAQYKQIYGYIKMLSDIGFKDYIIADISFLQYICEQDAKKELRIHLSGEACQLNSLSVEYLNQYNIARYIFHRKNTIDQMVQIIRNNREPCEYEAFVMNEKCNYTGAYCNSLHCDELVHMCMLPYELAPYSAERESGQNNGKSLCQSDLYNRTGEKNIQEEFYDDFDAQDDDYLDADLDNVQHIPGESGCGLCAVRALKEAGITHLKVVGRGEQIQNMVEDIRALKKVIDHLDVMHEREEIVKCVFDKKCSGNCYY